MSTLCCYTFAAVVCSPVYLVSRARTRAVAPAKLVTEAALHSRQRWNLRYRAKRLVCALDSQGPRKRASTPERVQAGGVGLTRGAITVTKPALLAKLTCNEGQRDALLAVIADIGMKNVSGEPGTEIYVAHKDTGDENVVWFYEVYTDEAALAAHGGSEEMKEFRRATGEFVAGRPELIFLEPVVAKGIEL
ncbi:MAG TPA: hypothetical protein DEP66_04125 [Acidimicrobiaceae bacterium]|nr:hypothetical protein [Acidimicrobiaceae bacterium]